MCIAVGLFITETPYNGSILDLILVYVHYADCIGIQMHNLLCSVCTAMDMVILLSVIVIVTIPEEIITVWHMTFSDQFA